MGLTPLLFVAASLTQPAPARQAGAVPAFDVRPGYRVSLAAEIDNARFLEFGPDGTLYVSIPTSGEVLALRDEDGDGAFEKRTTFISGYPSVHGLCWHDDELWFAQSGAIHKARDADGDGRADQIETVVPEGRVPSGGGHWWRSLLVTDDAIYTSIGDSGNITDEASTERQKVFRFSRDGSGKALFASGVRNTEKLRLRPGTNEVWGVDHGSDWFGREYGERRGQQPITDRLPADEFNHYTQDGFYGHPFIVDVGVPRLEHRERRDIIDLAARHTPPAWRFGAHWAANGWTFLEKDHFGADHPGDAFVALRGSWNSSIRVGYGVERVLFDDHTGRPYGAVRIVTTLSPDGRVLARPVDCAEAPDGSVVFSCDATGRVYRISRSGEGPTPP
ncbi:MAG: PQQ-dependent sugar dehydrogenase [Phycisphaerales bacterium]|nr:PQQ-dependent sugar dehydrogenase [Phycisphaerales bacterium]